MREKKVPHCKWLVGSLFECRVTCSFGCYFVQLPSETDEKGFLRWRLVAVGSWALLEE